MVKTMNWEEYCHQNVCFLVLQGNLESQKESVQLWEQRSPHGTHVSQMRLREVVRDTVNLAVGHGRACIPRMAVSPLMVPQSHLGPCWKCTFLGLTQPFLNPTLRGETHTFLPSSPDGPHAHSPKPLRTPAPVPFGPNMTQISSHEGSYGQDVH